MAEGARPADDGSISSTRHADKERTPPHCRGAQVHHSTRKTSVLPVTAPSAAPHQDGAAPADRGEHRLEEVAAPDGEGEPSAGWSPSSVPSRIRALVRLVVLTQVGVPDLRGPDW
jgi:hypothetical protein